MNILKVILAIAVVILSSYALLTQNLNLLPYSLFLTGILTLVIGLIKLRENRKSFWGYVNIGASIFTIFVVVYTLPFN